MLRAWVCKLHGISTEKTWSALLMILLLWKVYDDVTVFYFFASDYSRNMAIVLSQKTVQILEFFARFEISLHMYASIWQKNAEKAYSS